MRVPASEKLEIIHLVEQSHLPARRTLEMLGIKPSTFYHWYDRFRTGGPEALEDRPSKPDRVWNRIPDKVRQRVVAMALDQPELSPRELATRFTEIASYYVSESSVYRLLKAHDLITSPAFIVIKAADEFKDKTTAPNQLWQTDFTYLKVIGWGWYYLSTILDDYSRYIIAWKLCTTMRAGDVPTHSNWRSQRQAATVQRSCTNHDCSATTDRVTSPAISPNGSRTAASCMFVARRAIRRRKARSNAGTIRSRTAFCSRTITCLAISRPKSRASSSTTITGATTKA